MRELSRREIGHGATAVGTALVRRRLDALEARLTALLPGGRGCSVCAGWTPNAVLSPDTPWDPPVSGGWPPELRCPRCGRQPLNTITVVYADADPEDVADWGLRRPDPARGATS